MYISPETNIKLLKNVKLDNTYNHTIYFNNANLQQSFFNSKVKHNLTNCTYQRIEKNMIKVGLNAEKCYDCNYLMFQNTAFGNKWFYAFITSVEYINNVTTEIYFEIDVMQTWFFDYETNICFIEREHVIDDVLGRHYEPEPVSLGEYIFNDYGEVISLVDMSVIIAIVDTADATDGTLYDGIYGSAKLFAYDSTDTQAINAKVNEYVQKPDAIIGMYMCPKKFIGEYTDTHQISFGGSAIKQIARATQLNSTMGLQGYIPKNRKLYTYPYNFYHIDNASGSELSLRYEFFENFTPVFEIAGCITQPVQVTLRPCEYKGSGTYSELGGHITYNAECLSLNNFPLCSWNVDAYQAWIAQNSVPVAISSLTYGAGLAATALSATPGVGVAIGAVALAARSLSQAYQASISADISKGNLNNGSVNVANNKQTFYGGRCSITQYTARCIDEFFDRFGYAVNRLKNVQRNYRPHWNYVKTGGCSITGSVPADDMKKIISIYDNGITFWNNGNEIGDYSLNNEKRS